MPKIELTPQERDTLNRRRAYAKAVREFRARHKGAVISSIYGASSEGPTTYRQELLDETRAAIAKLMDKPVDTIPATPRRMARFWRPDLKRKMRNAYRALDDAREQAGLSRRFSAYYEQSRKGGRTPRPSEQGLAIPGRKQP